MDSRNIEIEEEIPINFGCINSSGFIANMDQQDISNSITIGSIEDISIIVANNQSSKC